HLSTPYTILNIWTANDNFDAFGSPANWLSAAFIQQGAFAGDLLLAEYATDQTDLLLIDPRRVTLAPDSVPLIAEAHVNDKERKQWSITAEDAEGIIAIGQSAYQDILPPTRALDIVAIPPNAQPSAYSVSVKAYSTV